MKNVYYIKSYEGNEIIESIIKSEKIILLVGSAISQWPPSNIPSGISLSRSIIKILIRQISSNRKKIFNLIKNIPFEYINEKCPNPLLLKKLLVDEFYPKTSNKVHLAIINLVKRRIIQSVITTNYDTCLDDFIPNGLPLIHIIKKIDAQNINKNSRVLFKIHGSADPKNRKTMVFELSKEGVMQKWKREIIKKILTDRCLLVIGYSGLDFEICPELMQIPLSSFLWNCHRDPNRYKSDLSEYPKRLIDKHNGYILWGDLRDILNALGEKVHKTQNIISKNNFSQKLYSSFSNKEILDWSCSLFAQPGYAKQTFELAEKFYSTCKMNLYDYGKYNSFLAESYFSMGKYKKSVNRCRKASKLFLAQNNGDQYFASEFRKIDSLRCWGKLENAKDEIVNLYLIVNSDKKYEKKYKSNLQLQEVLLLREEFERARILNLNVIAERKREKIRLLLCQIVKKAEKGKLYDLQQCRLWANRVGIPFDEVYKGSLQPLDDWFGYRKLGHLVAEMMSARDSLWRVGTKIKALQFLKYIEISEIIGSAPEQWKLILAYKKHFRTKETKIKMNWLFSFLFCEYTLSMRFFKLISEKYR